MLIVNRQRFSLTEIAASRKLLAASLASANLQEASSQTLAAKIVIGLIAILFLTLNGFGQIIGQFDTTKTAELDTLTSFKGKKVITIESYSKRFDPRKALLYAAVFPGAGQAYNNSYWKLPIVYGGFVGGGIAVNTYQQRYKLYKSELFSILNEPGSKLSPRGYTEDQLRSFINTNRRQRDYFCALIGLWYVLQLVDAHVEAHLKEFDLNPQLQVRVEPSMERNSFLGRSTGFSLKIRF